MGSAQSRWWMEKENYLYLAHSKLRTCAVGPELVVAGEAAFQDVTGTVSIQRQGQILWQANFYSGQINMCHSLANLEHHHFKYEVHRRPGDLHVYFFGADAFSFGESVRLHDGDMVEIGAPDFGKPLRNPIAIAREDERPVQVSSLR
jgi:hypothetical protein